MSVIRKPWGYEYLAYQNEDVALWVLHIKAGEQTSLHCHPKKTTGLVLIEGLAELSFLSDSRVISAPDKCMIRRGLFHQTKALTDCVLLEVETPPDKADLIRLDDKYGRASEGCETRAEPSRKPIVKINTEGDYGIFTISRKLVDNNPKDIVMFLRGGLYKTVDGVKRCITAPGDVGRASIVRFVESYTDGLEPESLILTVKA